MGKINTNLATAYHTVKRQVRKHTPALRRWLFGMQMSDGVVYKAATYVILTTFGFVFLYPLLYMLSLSFMSNLDLIDNRVEWLPMSLYTFNYEMTWRALDLPGSYITTTILSGLTTLCVAISSALIGYGLARLAFPGKRIVFALLLFTYIVPKTLFFLPRYQIFLELGLKGNIGAIVAPALTGQGEQAALFILIFYQFFKMIPKALEEAAFLDGAGAFRTFLKIAVPMSGPAFIIVGMYAFAIYWNETFLTSFYLEGKIQTVPMLLGDLKNTFGQVLYNARIGDASRDPNLNFTEAKLFAGTLLSIIPMVLFYLIVQKWFVQSIDKSGITGE